MQQARGSLWSHTESGGMGMEIRSGLVGKVQDVVAGQQEAEGPV